MVFTLATWLHDLDPFLWRITPSFGVRWYGLSYVLSFGLAWLLLSWLARTKRILLSPEQVTDAMLFLILGVALGGRLGYIVLYQPALLWEFTSAPPFWGALAIHKGGMASHGGMVGVLVACWLIARRAKAPALHLADCVALVAPIGLMLGRLANFVNGELLGRIVAGPGEAAPWWSVRFPQEFKERMAEGVTPAQVVQREQLLGGFARPNDTIDMAFDRMMDAVRAENGVLRGQLEQLVNARHPSQLYQAFAEGLVVLVVLAFVWRKPRRPGVVAAWFLIVYGVGRIVTEFYRLPDVGVRGVGPLSRGQSLSAVMVLCGVGLLVWRMKKPAERIGGLVVHSKAEVSA
ncbi:MAG: prolipoprotein diacylglyceryl transferase [Phycisphaerales bacterium]|nr:prolipoprotein diacylglyceryl transferase [Phycisphaerales bacterium]